MTVDRRSFIGGSDVAAIMGLSPWMSAYELWELKTAEEPAVEDNSPAKQKVLERGKRLEPYVIEMIEAETGIFIQKRNQIYSYADSWIRAEIDFEFTLDTGEVANGEIKTVSPFAAKEWGEVGTDEIPLHYALQALWGQFVTGRKHTLVAALIGADDLRLYEVHYDAALVDEIYRRACAFWELVQTKTPPPPANADDAVKVLSKFGGFVSKGSPEVWEAVRSLRRAKKAMERIKALRERHEFTIKNSLLLDAGLHAVFGQPVDPQKFTILDASGKKLATLNYQHRAAYEVKATSFFVLRI